MIQWSTNRVNPAVAARTAMPAGTTRQANAMASRAQFRAAEVQRGAPTVTQRGAATDDKDDDEKKPEKEPLFGRDEDPNDDGLDNPDANETDTDTDPDEDDEDKDVQVVVVS